MFARFGHLRRGFAREGRVIKKEVGTNMEEVVYPRYGDRPNKKDQEVKRKKWQ